MLLSIFIGSGCQTLLMVSVTLGTLSGLLPPSQFRAPFSVCLPRFPISGQSRLSDHLRPRLLSAVRCSGRLCLCSSLQDIPRRSLEDQSHVDQLPHSRVCLFASSCRLLFQPNHRLYRILFGVFFFTNLLLWSKGSSAAVPFGTLVALLALWLFVQTPMTFVGAFFGFKKKVGEIFLFRNALSFSFSHSKPQCAPIKSLVKCPNRLSTPSSYLEC